MPAVGLAAAPLLGFLFGVGWTPCVGPTLGVINTLSVSEATAGRGALLAAVFAFGLGLPFIAAAVAFLASDDAAWVTGTTLRVDGGVLAVQQAFRNVE